MTSPAKPLGLARRTLGIILLATTVFLWTASNFLLSGLLANDSYSKPYFITYVNTAFFSLFLLISGAKRLVTRFLLRRRPLGAVLGSTQAESTEAEEAETFLHSPTASVTSDDHGILVDDGSSRVLSSSQLFIPTMEEKLTTRETMRLALEFCLFWFFANFTLSVALEYTSVGSAAVIGATNSVWTLLLGTYMKVERFTLVKLFGVIISLAGVALISMVDLSGDSDKHRGNFPHKSTAQLALGDVLVLTSAFMYTGYTVFIKKRVGNEERIDMVLFFGFVGLLNTLILWPGMILLHFVGLEPFELPPTERVTYVVLVNSIISIISDLCWGYSVVLTSPLVVTVGLSMSIPLSLLGQMIISSSSSSVTYWIGALLVFAAFILINHNSKESEELLQVPEGRNNRSQPREA